MRLAFVGKGGAGKSSIAGTFARLLAATGRPVLAIDSDPMPGLAFSLGVGGSDAGIPDEAVEVVEGGDRPRLRLAEGLTAGEVVERWSARGPEGVRFLQLGKARGPRWDNSRQHAAFQHVVDGLADQEWSVVGDLPGGTRQPFQTWGRYASTVVAVVEPTPASELTGRRLARLAQMPTRPRVVVVASKVSATGDGERVARRTGLPLLGAVPRDQAVVEADRAGLAVLDTDPSGPYVAAVASLVDALLSEEGS